MLTKETLSTVTGLTEEQITAIETLSRNDEAEVISKRIREIYSGLDDDILQASGIKKGGSEKTYDYVKRVIGAVKVDVSEYEWKIQTLQSERDQLEQQIKSGKGSAALVASLEKQISDKDSLITQLQNDRQSLEEDYKTRFADKQKEFAQLKVLNAMREGADKLKYKKGYDDAVINTFARTAQNKVLGLTPDFEFEGPNGKQLVFRDSNGDILRNRENNLQPYTAAELYQKELAPILDTGRQANGAGTKPGQGSGGINIPDVSAATTKVEATRMINKVLASEGLAAGTEKHQQRFNEIWTESESSKLPMQ